MVNAIGANSAYQTSNPSSSASQDTLGRDAFLNLLVTQLQHQDPTQPQADGEFLAQLATFSALEQLQHHKALSGFDVRESSRQAHVVRERKFDSDSTPNDSARLRH